jgi:hypothetical protein
VRPRHSSGGCNFSGVDAVCALFRGPVCLSMLVSRHHLASCSVVVVEFGLRSPLLPSSEPERPLFLSAMSVCHLGLCCDLPSACMRPATTCLIAIGVTKLF